MTLFNSLVECDINFVSVSLGVRIIIYVVDVGFSFRIEEQSVRHWFEFSI